MLLRIGTAQGWRCRKNDEMASASNVTPGFNRTSEVSQLASKGIDTQAEVQDTDSYFQPAGLITPASKEGHRTGIQALHAQSTAEVFALRPTAFEHDTP